MDGVPITKTTINFYNPSKWETNQRPAEGHDLNYTARNSFAYYESSNYCKVTSSNTSCLEAHAGFYRLLM